MPIYSKANFPLCLRISTWACVWGANMAPCVVKLGTRWKWPAPCFGRPAIGERIPDALEFEVGGSQSRSGGYRQEKHLLSSMPFVSSLEFLDQNRYFFSQAAPQLYSRGWVDPLPDLLLFLSCSARESNPGLWICSQELWSLDHRCANWSWSHITTWR
jgi:hypothetical protein